SAWSWTTGPSRTWSRWLAEVDHQDLAEPGPVDLEAVAAGAGPQAGRGPPGALAAVRIGRDRVEHVDRADLLVEALEADLVPGRPQPVAADDHPPAQRLGRVPVGHRRRVEPALRGGPEQHRVHRPGPHGHRGQRVGGRHRRPDPRRGRGGAPPPAAGTPRGAPPRPGPAPPRGPPARRAPAPPPGPAPPPADVPSASSDEHPPVAVSTSQPARATPGPPGRSGPRGPRIGGHDGDAPAGSGPPAGARPAA